MSSKIPWCQETWNPIVGCSKVSPGCDNCYAERMAKRLGAMNTAATDHYHFAIHEGRWIGLSQMNETAFEKPRQWVKPRLVFVCSMGDLFHKSVPDEWIDQVFGFITLYRMHRFLVLTKRAERMRDYFLGLQNDPAKALRFGDQKDGASSWTMQVAANLRRGNPIPNLWLGVTAENQKTADERIPLLLETPAAGRFVSVEPMLGPVLLPRLDWVICGGESGPGARPAHPDWVRNLRDQCSKQGIPFMFKQWGEWCPATEEYGITGHCMPDTGEKFTWIGFDGKTQNPSSRGLLAPVMAIARQGKKRAGRMLDGREWMEFPAELMTRGVG